MGELRTAERGQVLIMCAVLLVVLLGFAGLAIDVGRQNAENRHIQSAADAAALAACRALINGASEDTAKTEARTIARVNLEGSPSGTAARIASGSVSDPYLYADGHAGDPAYLISGVWINGVDVRIAILARRYPAAPGPGGGFQDFLATDATSKNGTVDSTSVLGYGGREKASI